MVRPACSDGMWLSTSYSSCFGLNHLTWHFLSLCSIESWSEWDPLAWFPYFQPSLGTSPRESSGKHWSLCSRFSWLYTYLLYVEGIKLLPTLDFCYWKKKKRLNILFLKTPSINNILVSILWWTTEKLHPPAIGSRQLPPHWHRPPV